MRISVLVHGHFKSTSSVGMEEQTYSFPDGTGMRIRDLLNSINIMEEEVQQILMNGRRARLDEPVRHRVNLQFFPKERYTGEKEEGETAEA